MDRLPLFDWKPECRVISFPQGHRVGRVRQTAKALAAAKTQRAKLAYWRRTVDTICSHLLRAGIAQEEAESQIKDFRTAVQAELNRMARGRQRPDGSAA